jgi:hypothetical protein
MSSWSQDSKTGVPFINSSSVRGVWYRAIASSIASGLGAGSNICCSVYDRESRKTGLPKGSPNGRLWGASSGTEHNKKPLLHGRSHRSGALNSPSGPSAKPSTPVRFRSSPSALIDDRRITLSVNRDTLLTVRSVRLDPELDDLVRRAAAREGASVSEFLRRAAADRARHTLEGDDDLDDVIGAVRTTGGAARRTGAAFGELLQGRRRER